MLTGTSPERRLHPPMGSRFTRKNFLRKLNRCQDSVSEVSVRCTEYVGVRPAIGRAYVQRVSDLKPAAPAADRQLIDDWTSAAEVISAVQQAVLGRVAAAGIPAQWIAVLRLLHDATDQRMTMSEIARNLTMSSGGFTKLADRMARDGLIDRRGVSTDRRVVHAVLTERGRILAEECTRAYNEAVASLVLAAISERDVKALSRLAAQLNPVRDLDPVTPEGSSDAFLIRPPSLASPDRRGQGAGTATRV